MKQKIEENIRLAGELACLLEVSGTPKPGNVHRLYDFGDTRYEHFLAGAIAIGPCLEEAAKIGVAIGEKKKKVDDACVGKLIYDAMESTRKWHRGGNTNFGIIMLFVPLALAAGKTKTELGSFDSGTLRKNAVEILKKTTTDDAVAFVEAVGDYIAFHPQPHKQRLKERYKGKKKYDILSPDFKRTIRKEKKTLFELLKSARRIDAICEELFTWKNTFDVGLPIFTETLDSTGDINIATVNTHLALLSRWDQFEKTKNTSPLLSVEEVAGQAKNAFELGGLKTDMGRIEVEHLDRKLERAHVNTGAAADFVATTLFVGLLQGGRP
ncbi:MAG: triphosphoribosyl-dephospho-CoA synthase [Candidatus Altiarchaeota archaeon]